MPAWWLYYRSRPSFNPRLPGGRRLNITAYRLLPSEFQSTPSGGKATEYRNTPIPPRRFQSTPSGGKATRIVVCDIRHLTSFNPRLPGGRRHYACRQRQPGTRRFNPRLPGGRRRLLPETGRSVARFNPRLPGGRRQPATRLQSPPSLRFNPRLPGGRRPNSTLPKLVVSSFNPRLPGGRRLYCKKQSHYHRRFQSTPSGGKATAIESHASARTRVSIHAFRGEGDDRAAVTLGKWRWFQSTPSGGKATPGRRDPR